MPAAACLLTVLSSCLSVEWSRDRRLEPISDAEIAEIRPGETELDDVLDAFGAPLFVREYKTYGAEVSYGWFSEQGWGFTVSLPVSDSYSLSFDYDQINARMRGLVLLFDDDLQLVSARRGYLRELLGDVNRQPAYIDDADEQKKTSGS